MTRYKFALRIGASSILLLFVSLLALEYPRDEIAEVIVNSTVAQFLSIFFSVCFSASGIYLWFTGFKRFEPIIGNFGPAWLIYVSFFVFSGFYMEYRYGSTVHT